jgi:hypothetical protein
MSAGSSQGYIVNLFAFGLIMIGVGKIWDLFGSTVNKLSVMGMMTQDGANTFGLLTLCFYGLGILFLLAGGYNVILEGRRGSTRQV